MIGCFALHSAAVDPDDLLRAFRRVSFRSALTAALATRLVPVLARDARRLARRAALPRRRAGAAARRSCAPWRAARWTAPSTSPRRSRCAATAPPGARRAAARRPWSRHDLAFAASAVALALLGIGAWARDVEALRAPTRRSARPSAPAQLGAVRGARARARCCRSPTGGGSGDERGAAARAASPTAIPARPRRRCATSTSSSSRASSSCSPAGRARASRRCCAPPPAWCRTSTAASSPAALEAGGLDTRTHEPGRARRGRRHRCSRTPRRRS